MSSSYCHTMSHQWFTSNTACLLWNSETFRGPDTSNPEKTTNMENCETLQNTTNIYTHNWVHKNGVLSDWVGGCTNQLQEGSGCSNPVASNRKWSSTIKSRSGSQRNQPVQAVFLKGLQPQRIANCSHRKRFGQCLQFRLPWSSKLSNHLPMSMGFLIKVSLD